MQAQRITLKAGRVGGRCNAARYVGGARTRSAVVAKGTDRDIQIIPSVLPADWANMGAAVAELEAAGVDRIQFDVMDGNFVPNLTFGPEMIAACRKYCKTPFETQLMVSQYASETMLKDYVDATKGPNGEPGVVIIHVEVSQEEVTRHTFIHRERERERKKSFLSLFVFFPSLSKRFSDSSLLVIALLLMMMCVK